MKNVFPYLNGHTCSEHIHGEEEEGGNTSGFNFLCNDSSLKSGSEGIAWQSSG